MEKNFTTTTKLKNKEVTPKTGKTGLPNGKTLKKKRKSAKTFLGIISQKMSPVSRIVPKTLRRPPCSQNVLFLVNMEKEFDETKLEKAA